MTEQQITAAVRDAVNAYDSEGLLKMGCPSDEYNPEIESIASGISQVMGIRLKMPIPTVDQLWIIICNVLHRFFGMADAPVCYWQKHKELAQAIREKLE